MLGPRYRLGPSLLEAGYQGRGDFRGRGNLLLMVETLVVRCVVPALIRVSAYGLPWFAFF